MKTIVGDGLTKTDSTIMGLGVLAKPRMTHASGMRCNVLYICSAIVSVCVVMRSDRPSQSHRRWAPAHAHNGDVEPCDTPSPDLVAQQKRVPGHAVHHGNIVPRSDESPLLNCYIRGVSLVPDGHEP